MLRIRRVDLPKPAQNTLEKRQNRANQKHATRTLQVGKEWDSARKSSIFQTILRVLKSMAGNRERCMYCLDSHGTDIEHFWPKTPYPERMFDWQNLLLCCTECGRLKGERFPLSEIGPLLIDPTAEDPWLHLDFDPTTGNIVARFELRSNSWSAKGLKTVEVFHLDRREAMAAGYRRTYMRLADLVSRYLTGEIPEANMVVRLRDADDHGLLDWCFLGSGRNEQPFVTLREQHQKVWKDCVSALHPYENSQ